MSTKTNFKRVALVAVAALGLGVLSSVPSQAAVNSAATITVTNGSGATLTNSDSTTAATVAVRFFAESDADTATITFTLGTKPSTATAATADLLITALDTSLASGAASVLAGKNGTTGAWATPFGTDSTTASTANGKITPGGAGNAYGKFGVFLDTRTVRVAGTYTVDYQVKIFSDGALAPTLGGTGSVSIVVTDGTSAAAGAVSAAGTSTALMKGAASYSAVLVDDVVTAVNTPSISTAVAVIRVEQKTSAGLPSRESITVTTNVGNVGIAGTGATGKTVTFVGNANGINDIGVYPDGTSGTATITIKTTSVTFSSKTVTFYSTTVDKIVAVALGTTVGGSAANVIAAKAYDAQGNQIIDNTSVYAYSSDTSVVNTGTSTGTACSYVADVKAQICSLSGAADGTASITLRNKSTAALSTVASNVIALKVNTKSPVSVKMAFDKATYAPGEAAYLRIWAVDAAGAIVAPTTSSSNLIATGGITSSVAFGNGSASSDSLTAVSLPLSFTTVDANGYASTDPIYMVKVFMPYSGGTVSAYVTGGTNLPLTSQVKVTATATVTDSAAAALAAVTALATTVASLRTLITTLTNLVLKIQKKVKA